MPKHALAVCSLLLLAGCATSDRRPGPAGRRLDAQDQAFSEALAHYSQALLYESERGRGAPETLEEFLRVIEKDPACHAAYSKAALAALYRRDIPRAIAILEQSCKRNPTSLQSRIDLAITYQITAKIEQAMDSFRTAIRLDPAQPFAYIGLARLHFFREQDAKAVAVMEEGLAFPTVRDQVLSFAYNQARFFVEQGQGLRAIPCLDLIRQTDAVAKEYVYALTGDVYASLGRTNDAVRAFELAIESAPTSPDTYVRLSLYCLRFDVDRAVDVLRQADARLTDEPGILLPLAFIRATQRQDAEALEIFDHVQRVVDERKQAPMSPEAYLHFGAIAERGGQIDRAERIFGRGLELHPDADEILNYLAYMWAERNINLDRALAYVQRALQSEPDNGAYIDTLGWIYFRMARLPDALDEIRRAIGILKDDPTVLDHLGDVHQAMGQTGDAVEAWQRSYAADPANAKVAAKLRAAGVEPAPLPAPAPAPPPAGPSP